MRRAVHEGVLDTTQEHAWAVTALQQAITFWHLREDEAMFTTATSLLQPVLAQGKPAMLKVPLCVEERRGLALLRWWQGDCAVRVLAAHSGAVLMERACGTRSLIAMSQGGQDAEATRILCAVAARLHAQSHTPLPELTPLNHCFAALEAAGARQGRLFAEAAAIARALLAAPHDMVVLHGDIHHANVLDGGKRGWLAIDPKGLYGERGFDYANIFCNPDYAVATRAGRFEQQLTLVAEMAALEPERLLAWIAAWAALSAVWHMEDGGNPETALAIAQKALSLRG